MQQLAIVYVNDTHFLSIGGVTLDPALNLFFIAASSLAKPPPLDPLSSSSSPSTGGAGAGGGGGTCCFIQKIKMIRIVFQLLTAGGLVDEGGLRGGACPDVASNFEC